MVHRRLATPGPLPPYAPAVATCPATPSAPADAVIPAPPGPARPELVSAALERYLDPTNAHTARDRRIGLATFQAWAQAPNLDVALVRLIARGPDYAEAVLDQWRQALVREDYADNTIRARILAVTGCLRLLRNVGAIIWRIKPPVPSADAYSARSTAGCGVEGFHALVRAAHGQPTPLRERDVAWLLLLWRGLRVGEVVDLDLEHVELAPSPRLNILGKWRTRREWLDLADYQAEALASWLAIRGNKPGPLFWRLDRARPTVEIVTPARSRRERRTMGGLRLSDMGLRKAMLKIGALAGLPAAVCHPHALRHASGTELLDRDGGNIRRMMQFLRIRNSATAIRYDDNRMRQGREAAEILGGATLTDLLRAPVSTPDPS